MLFNIPYILFSRDHNENKAFKALFCVIPAITSQLVFNFFNWFIFTWYCNYLFNWLCNILFMAKYTYLPTYLPTVCVYNKYVSGFKMVWKCIYVLFLVSCNYKWNLHSDWDRALSVEAGISILLITNKSKQTIQNLTKIFEIYVEGGQL